MVDLYLVSTPSSRVVMYKSISNSNFLRVCGWIWFYCIAFLTFCLNGYGIKYKVVVTWKKKKFMEGHVVGRNYNLFLNCQRRIPVTQFIYKIILKLSTKAVKFSNVLNFLMRARKRYLISITSLTLHETPK